MLAKIKDDVYIRISQGTYFIMAAKPRYIYHCFFSFHQMLHFSQSQQNLNLCLHPDMLPLHYTIHRKPRRSRYGGVSVKSITSKINSFRRKAYISAWPGFSKISMVV